MKPIIVVSLSFVRAPGLAVLRFQVSLNRTGCSPRRLAFGAIHFTAHESHFPAKAKSVIFLFMYGGVSQVDTLDPKPELAGFTESR
jgi:hypothetical protein